VGKRSSISARVKPARFFDGLFGTFFMFCIRTLLTGHHERTITVYENGKLFLPNLSLNNDPEIIRNKILVKNDWLSQRFIVRS